MRGVSAATIVDSIQLKTHVNDQGILQISLPEHSGEELEVLLVYQPIAKTKKRQWSQSFLDTCGAWQGEALEREAQEIPAERDALL